MPCLPLFCVLLAVLCSVADSLTVIPKTVIKVTAKPGAAFAISWTVDLPDFNGKGSDLVARYLRDADLPASNALNPESLPPIGADLVFVKKNGISYTFSKSFLAYQYEALFQPVFGIAYKSSALSAIEGGVTTVGKIDITCSDGVYCNGIERYVRNKCVAATAMPCVTYNKDGTIDMCSSYTCLEDTKMCASSPLGGLKVYGGQCETCKADICIPDCTKATCGDDGCGGTCGTCGIDATSGTQTYCVSGVCSVITQEGSCANPKPLFGTTSIVPASGTGGTMRITGDSSKGVDMIRPVCQTGNMKEWVYKFTIPAEAVDGMGFEIRATGNDGTEIGDIQFDSILAIHNADCTPYVGTAVDHVCNDDANPPGKYGSRVDGRLPPGDYTLIVTAYDDTGIGPFLLLVKFVPGCNPKCDTKQCGSDDCGGSCGNCQGNLLCSAEQLCVAPVAGYCVPDCKQKECGPDGCGGTCGTCKHNKVCDDRENTCVPVKACNSHFPNCPNNRQGLGPKDSYCGADCAWHRMDELLPDLTPSSQIDVLPTVRFKWVTFSSQSCALVEGCVRGEGRRLLMTFDTRVHNIGTTDFIGLDISRNPDLFVWATCHQHYHFQKFARFALYNYEATNLVLPGGKLSYCMRDDAQYSYGNNVPCTRRNSCSSQGIPRGRSDIYDNTLDCQWLDITELYEQNKLNCWYSYEICTNIGRTIFEMTFDNNCRSFPMYIASVPDDGNIYTLDDVMNRDNAKSFQSSANHCKL